MLSNVVTVCIIFLSLTGIPNHSLLSSRRTRSVHIFPYNQFSMGHLISGVSPSHNTAICVSRTHLWGGAEILRHAHNYVTNDLSPSIDPFSTQCFDIWSTHSPAFPTDEYRNDQPLQGLHSSCYIGSRLFSPLALKTSRSLMVLGTLASPLALSFLSP